MIDRDYITKTCDSLPMVTWDRCVLMEAHAVVYGWTPAPHQRLIKEQEVGRHDFVALQFWFDPPDEPMHSFLTSIVTQSPKIHEILEYADEHLECQTVQDELPDLKKKVNR